MCVFKDGREFEGIAVLTINDKFYGLAIINEFIINYMGESEFGYGEELKKAIIKYYTHNAKMKEFFSFVKEKNPNIDFHSENAACDGIDTKEFDYFVDKCQKLDYGI